VLLHPTEFLEAFATEVAGKLFDVAVSHQIVTGQLMSVSVSFVAKSTTVFLVFV
jgi:hypothetical protein